MLNYRLPSDEQETVISHNRAGKMARIYTSDRLVMPKLDKLCREHPNVYKCVWVDSQILGDGLPMAKRYEVEKKYVRHRVPISEKSLEQRREIARNNKSLFKPRSRDGAVVQNEVEVGTEKYTTEVAEVAERDGAVGPEGSRN